MKKSMKIYHFNIDESTLDVKTTPQITQIYKIVLKNGELEISEDNLKKLLEEGKKDGVLKTGPNAGTTVSDPQHYLYGLDHQETNNLRHDEMLNLFQSKA